MTRWLLLSVCACVLAFPVSALGGNAAPKLSLEVYWFEEEPVPTPSYVCVHDFPPVPTQLECYAPRLQYHYYYMPLHVGALDHPICSTHGVLCFDYGGYEGVFFGVQQTAPTGHPLTFMSWNACPGFLKGPSAAGEPAACGASSTALCHDWDQHEGYLVFFNAGTNTDKVYFDVVNNADLNHHKVISCHSQYDEGTTVASRVQVGGAQDVICPDPTPVEDMTWGAIKGLYR